MAEVVVRGLNEFRRELNASSKALGRDFAKVNQEFGEPIAAAARGKARARGGVAGKTAQSIRSQRSQRGVRIVMGGPRFPFAWGAEFGSRRYRQFKPWTGNQWQPFSGGVGYFVHPAVRERAKDLDSHYLDAIDRFARIAFPD